ncbi:phosphatase PAP2 family protein [Terrabacter sp. NPDC000476]|uniref:phosphatase PAP2 family protein n=1 Tax=Terrabacter sp. NPDC000476 TaxID=3154258 RepID=UPI00332201D5
MLDDRPAQPCTSERVARMNREGADLSGTPGDIDVAHRTTMVLAGGGLLAIALALGFVLTAVGAARTGELALDESISRHRDAALSAVARGIDVGFGTTVAPVLLLVACGILWTRHRFAAVALGALTTVGWLSVELGKALVRRPRPPAATVHALVSETAADSYPSGHTAFVAAVLFASVAALALAGRRTVAAWLLGVPVVVVVGLSRLYLGVHYLGDVIASVGFAAASILVATVVARPALMRLRDDTTRAVAG